MILELSGIERKWLYNISESFKKMGLFANDSDDNGFHIFIDQFLHVDFLSGRATYRTKQEDRNALLLLCVYKGYCLCTSKCIEEYITDDDSFVDRKAISDIFIRIAEYIEAIIIANVCCHSAVETIISRAILEILWMLNVIAYFPDRREIYVDPTIDDTIKWSKYFKPSHLRKSLESIESDLLSELSDYQEYLKNIRKKLYNNYSKQAHSSYIAVQSKDDLTHNINTLWHEVCYMLYYSMLLYENTIVAHHKIKVAPTPIAIQHSVLYHFLKEASQEYLTDFIV